MPPVQNHELLNETLFIDGNFPPRDMLQISTNARSTSEYSGAVLKTSSDDADYAHYPFGKKA
jgi:hypothetical protein